MNTDQQCIRGCGRQARNYTGGLCEPHARAIGRIRKRVPAEPTRTHIQNLLNAGATQTGISRQSGISDVTIRHILQQRSATISGRTAESIQAVTTPPKPAPQPAWPYRRRLQSLRAAGWRLDELHALTGLNPDTIVRICNHRWDTINPATAKAIEHAWQQCAHKPIRPAPNRIKNNGWALPMEWDNIDDPGENPAETRRQSVTGRLRHILTLMREETGGANHVSELCGVNHTTVLRILQGKQTHVTPESAEKINRAYVTYRAAHPRREYEAKAAA